MSNQKKGKEKSKGKEESKGREESKGKKINLGRVIPKPSSSLKGNKKSKKKK